MKEFPVIYQTSEGQMIAARATEETLERLRVQAEMLKEYGSDPMVELPDGEYIIVRDVIIPLEANK